MRIVDVIRAREPEIIEEAVKFAQTLAPFSGEALDSDVLRDHLPLILRAIVLDLDQAQSIQEEIEKSEGQAPAAGRETAAQTHGRMRAESGLSIVQVVAEFRVLRSVISRMWTGSDSDSGIATGSREAAGDLVRFNEAIDQAVAESVAFHNAEAKRWRNALLGVISHDLRNPLQSLVMTAEVLRISLQGSPQEKSVGKLIAASDRLNTLLDSLLEYSQSQLGSMMKIAPTEVDLAAEISDEVAMVRAAHPDIHFKTEFENALRGKFDGSRLREAVSNLLSNAVQYSEPRSAIRITGKDSAHDVRVAVTNEGEPIADDARHTIFEPLRRTGRALRSATRQNMGLGLFIVKEVAKAHGGSAGVDCENGEVTFWIEVPKQRSAAAG